MLEELGLSPTGEVEEVPDSPVVGAALSTGWFLVFVNRGPLGFPDEPLPALSAGCKVVFCAVEEHVMSSLAACYVDGRLAWQVAHDSENGIYHLDSRGDVPEEFDQIFHAAKNEQDLAGGEKADVDYIHDVPIDLAKAITGFRHDEDIPGVDAEPFKVLAHVGATASNRPSIEPRHPSARPWWRFW